MLRRVSLNRTMIPISDSQAIHQDTALVVVLSDGSTAGLTADQLRQLTLHRTMGHSLMYPSPITCKTCLKAKGKRKAIRAKPYHESVRPCQVIAADIMGPMSVATSSGRHERLPTHRQYLYVLVLIDTFSRYVWIRLTKRKHHVVQLTVELLKHISVQYSQYRIECFHSDGGSEFQAYDVEGYCNSTGIRLSSTTPDKPSHNGKVERVNRTLMEITRSLMIEAGAPTLLWGYAVIYASVLYNSTPMKVLNGLSPFQKLTGKEPDVSKLHVWGSDVLYVPTEDKTDKLHHTAPAVWLGISTKHSTNLLMLQDGRTLVTPDVCSIFENEHANLPKFWGSEHTRDQLMDLDEVNQSIPRSMNSSSLIPHNTTVDTDSDPVSIYELNKESVPSPNHATESMADVLDPTIELDIDDTPSPSETKGTRSEYTRVVIPPTTDRYHTRSGRGGKTCSKVEHGSGR